MGVFSPSALKLRNLNVEVAADTIESTSTYETIVVEYEDHMNPFAFSINIKNAHAGGHNQDAHLEIRRVASYDQCRIFRATSIITDTIDQLYVFSPAVGTAQLDGGVGVISYTVPLLAYWPADTDLVFKLVWGSAPTSGSCDYSVVAHY